MTDDLKAEHARGLSRAEWEQQFIARIKERLGGTVDDVTEIAAAELESWPEYDATLKFGDWKAWGPADAADENLSYWEDDEN